MTVQEYFDKAYDAYEKGDYNTVSTSLKRLTLTGIRLR